MVERDQQHQKSVDVVLHDLRHAKAEGDRVARQIRTRVHQARAAGATWAEIGKVLSMTGQGAQKRYGLTGEERAMGHEHESARNALKAAKKKIRRLEAATGSAPQQGLSDPATPGPGDRWPDGSEQGTIDGSRE